jgi:hypothetical protein
MHETGADQWYYLDGSQTRGPVPGAQIAQLIQSGSLNGATQVAQAGASTWSPASVALAHLLGGARAASPIAPPSAPPTYAIRLACVSGPDHGKAYMIGSAEVALGRASGLGQGDPYVAENHLVLSWQNNILHFRTLAGAMVRVAGTDVTQGTLSNGQQFQMGMSMWTVGAAPVELTNLLGSLGSRLNQLTSTEKLEGFSVIKMFSEIFKSRKPGELEEYFLVGTTKTTPPIEEVQTGWPQPWVFMRVMGFMVALYALLYFMFNTWPNPKAIPALMIIGSLAIPLTTVFLFWELNTPRNVSFHMVLVLVFLGTAGSLIFTSALNKAVNLDWLGSHERGLRGGDRQAAHGGSGGAQHALQIHPERAVVRRGGGRWILRIRKRRVFLRQRIHFEPIGPAHQEPQPFSDDALPGIPAALADGGVSGGDRLHPFPRALCAFRTHGVDGHLGRRAVASEGEPAVPLQHAAGPFFSENVPGASRLAHAVEFADSQRSRNPGLWVEVKYLTLGLVGWYMVLLLVQQGLRQIKDMQVAHATEAIQQTQQVLDHDRTIPRSSMTIEPMKI